MGIKMNVCKNLKGGLIMKKNISLFLLLCCSFPLIFSGCSTEKNQNTTPLQNEVTESATDANFRENNKKTLLLGDAGWESITFHNAVATYILEKGYGYKTHIVTASSDALKSSIKTGELDILMEYWQNTDYFDLLKQNIFVEASVNFYGIEGIYVPTYMVKGDPARNIKPLIPKAKTVSDMNAYASYFSTPENTPKGVLYAGADGWDVVYFMTAKYTGYQLDKNYDLVISVNQAALDQSIKTAFDKGIPWFGYYWEPSVIMGQYEFTKLEEVPYEESTWTASYMTDFPNRRVAVVVNKDFPNIEPEAFAFLKNYKTDVKFNNIVLSHMAKENLTASDAAIWFFKTYPDMWHSWVTPAAKENIENSLQ
jgi:glycine betaine/proline transport system substrate-binding protein